LLSWADHRKSILHNIPASALLGLIVIIPISGMVGLMFAVILGVIIGSCLFGFEFWRKRK
jgi:ammonia channel protein AmtB